MLQYTNKGSEYEGQTDFSTGGFHYTKNSPGGDTFS